MLTFHLCLPGSRAVACNGYFGIGWKLIAHYPARIMFHNEYYSYSIDQMTTLCSSCNTTGPPLQLLQLIRSLVLRCVGSYSLSMLDQDANAARMVKHYRIRDLDNGGVYISPRQRFSDIVSVIQHYTGASPVVFLSLLSHIHTCVACCSSSVFSLARTHVRRICLSVCSVLHVNNGVCGSK